MGRVLPFLSCWFLLLGAGGGNEIQEDIRLLYRILDALTRGLRYVEESLTDINFDAVFCVKQVEEQLEAFLEFEPQVFKKIHNWVDSLRKQAKQTAQNGRIHQHNTNPSYSSALGFLLLPQKKLIWYPSTVTSSSAVVVPVPCASSVFYGNFSDVCFSQMSHRVDSDCKISPDCLYHNQNMTLQGYVITHQVLFWEMMESMNCIDKVSRQLRTQFCSNIMRDVLLAERLGFQLGFRDLFMEQIGVCGIWGFKDFHKKEWLEKIFEWQRPSGCFSELDVYYCEDLPTVTLHSRQKRSEVLLKDGCLPHKTGVALLALVASLRFEAEAVFNSKAQRHKKFL